MKVGTIIYSTTSGLGILAKDFYDNGIITDVLVQSHGRYKDNMHWYKNSDILSPVQDIANNRSETPKHKKDLINSFIDSVDILLLFELEWYSDVIQEARKRGKKVILMPMYECSPFPIIADCYLTVSDLDHKYYTQMYKGRNIKRINVPVNSSVKWKLRESANVFVHNAGNARGGDRNGTQALLDSIKFVKSKNIKIKIRSQHSNYTKVNDERVEYDFSEQSFENLWNEGDVFLFPERWNGLSLPIQEAYGSGMMIMCGNRFPMNKWLPNKPMINVAGYQKMRILPNIPFESAQYNPLDIASKIDEFANTDITKYSQMGLEWYEKNSWSLLKKEYSKIMEEIYEN